MQSYIVWPRKLAPLPPKKRAIDILTIGEKATINITTTTTTSITCLNHRVTAIFVATDFRPFGVHRHISDVMSINKLPHMNRPRGNATVIIMFLKIMNIKHWRFCIHGNQQFLVCRDLMMLQCSIKNKKNYNTQLVK